MDAIGELNLKLGDVEAQKYTDLSAGISGLAKGALDVYSEIDKGRLETALNGPYETVANEAKAQGIPESTIKAYAGMWNAASGVDAKKKIIADFFLICEKQRETEKVKKEFAGASSQIEEILNDKTLTDEEKQRKAILLTSSNPALLPLRSEFRLTLEEKQKRDLAKKDESSKRMQELANAFVVNEKLNPAAGRQGAASENAIELINRNSEKFIKYVAEKNPEILSVPGASERLISALKESIKPNVENPTYSPIERASSGFAGGSDVERIAEVGSIVKSAKLLKDNFKDDYLNNIPIETFARLQQWLNSSGASNFVPGDFNNNAKAANWWNAMSALTSEERHDLFGASFTDSERKSSGGQFVNLTNNADVIKGNLNRVWSKYSDKLRAYDKNPTFKSTVDGYRKYLSSGEFSHFQLNEQDGGMLEQAQRIDNKKGAFVPPVKGTDGSGKPLTQAEKAERARKMFGGN